MLVISRKRNEKILIGDDITVTVTRIDQNSVRIGIEAPRTMKVMRQELVIDAPEGEPIEIELPDSMVA